MPPRKIQLIIRDSGLASRRASEDLIREGRVTINGAVVEHPATLADPDKDHIKIDGKLLQPGRMAKRYYLFNKPRNVVSTMRDPEGRPCIGDVVKSLKKGLFAVGRLDFDAEGLMILTNDGELAQKLGHPRFRSPRTYMVKVKGSPDDAVLARVKPGMSIGDGDRIGEVKITAIKRQKTSSWFKVILFEGKRNEIKRIFLRIGHPVRRIKRVGFGPFVLGTLPSGQWRPLSDIEHDRMLSWTKRTTPGDPPARGPRADNRS